MKNNEQVSKRFNELNSGVKQIKTIDSEYGPNYYADEGTWQKWTTNVLNLLQRVFGEESIHYKNFHKFYSKATGYASDIDTAYQLFLAAKEDYEGGYLFNLQTQISGELLGDFVALAKSALAEHHKDVAAVLASAALEDALKRYAAESGLDVTNKSMQEVVNALKSKGLVSGAQKSLLDAMPKIRDFAMHANWDKLSEPDINSIIGFVEQFLLEHFS